MKACTGCKNFEYLYCPIIKHEITNGYAALAHAKKCKDYKKKKE